MRTTTRSAAAVSVNDEPQERVDSEDSEQVSSVDRPSRRSFVFLGALAAAAVLPKRAAAQAIRRHPLAPDTPANQPRIGIEPDDVVSAFAEWDSTGTRLVRRLTLGITPAEVQRANSMGYQGYLNYQLNSSRIDDTTVENAIAQKFPLMSQTSDTLFSADSGQVQSQLRDSTLYRAAFSQRQLHQRMTEFWSDHFNQDIDKVGYLLVADQRDVIRKNALGKFPDLLKASAHSASMMVYLDQSASRNTAPNQNYAREIMELHTLGVDGGYTQNDVAELSRVLTGWTVQGRGQFVFRPELHDWGSKTVLGVTIPAGSPSIGADGIKEGEQMLDLLVNHPSTARFIAGKMLRWLLTPNPTETQIAAVASAYRATGGDIKSMVRAILNETWLPASPMKLKRPFHYLASTMRSTNATVAVATNLSNSLTVLGQQLFAWATPDGYPDKIEYWAGNILPRWSFATSMSNFNSATAVVVDTTQYRAGTAQAAIDLIDQNFFGGEMPSVTRTGLLSYLTAGTFNDTRVRETIALAMSANAFQWY
jgi:uncharacterized protein (DUF1800 family)